MNIDKAKICYVKARQKKIIHYDSEGQELEHKYLIILNILVMIKVLLEKQFKKKKLFQLNALIKTYVLMNLLISTLIYQ